MTSFEISDCLRYPYDHIDVYDTDTDELLYHAPSMYEIGDIEITHFNIYGYGDGVVLELWVQK